MPDDEDDRDQDQRIEDLKRRAEELAGGEMITGGEAACLPDVEEGFWKHVVDWEEAPDTSNFQQLERAGVSLPAPETLNDEELTAKLWEVIFKLALLRVFVEETDHLSDRELYTQLWSDSLREETKDLPPDPDSAWHIQMLGSGSEEDTNLYLKYYADEDWREHWREEFPDYPIPNHEDPPYDRDRRLPKPDYGPPSEESIN